MKTSILKRQPSDATRRLNQVIIRMNDDERAAIYNLSQIAGITMGHFAYRAVMKEIERLYKLNAKRTAKK